MPPKRSRSKDFIFVGRDIDNPIALEGALKLKEVSYIHAECCPTGELKHGPKALVNHKLPFVVLATEKPEQLLAAKARQSGGAGLLHHGVRAPH